MTCSKRFLLIVLVFSAGSSYAQSATSERLVKQYDAFTLFFYHNTLRMFNQKDNKEFDDMVKNIDKMRFMIIDKAKDNFAASDYKKLVSEFQEETFESVLTSRVQGMNFDIYMKERNGSTLGTVMLVNDSTNLYILDILGSIDLSKANQFFSALQENADVGNQIKSLLDNNSRRRNRSGSVEVD